MSLSLLPQPKRLTPGEGAWSVPARGVIGIASSAFYPVAAELQSLLKGFRVNASYPGSRDDVALACDPALGREAYRLAVSPAGVRIEAATEAGAFYAVQTLRQLLAAAPKGRVPAVTIQDEPDFADRGVYYDVTRGRVPTLKELLRLADRLSRFKINQLQLYIEHTFLFRGHPDIGKGASPLEAEDILKLDAHCRARHIELVPSLASFGHLSTVLQHPRYHALAEDWGVGRYADPDAPPGWGLRGWTLSPANPDSYAFLDGLFAEFLPLFSSGRFNACCDETYDLGWGQSYELCRKRGKGRVYLDHLIKVADLARKYGKKTMFWGDIIRHHPDLIADIPQDLTVLDWGYGHNHPFEAISDFKKAGLEFFACPGTNSWIALFPRLPEACANIAGFAAAGKRHGARGLLNTDWGDGGHYNFMDYSWHGYLFGAEQAWNTGADQATFTRRFIATFLGADDPVLGKALDELGEISFRSPGNSSIWQSILFALPDDGVFRQTQPVGATFVRDGKIVSEPYRLDAALARSLLPRLKRIRGVFAARAGRRGFDRDGVLPYWVFAADTLLLAVRKLAAFGPGAKPNPKERAAIRAEMRSLRQRFKSLWMARNRPSEIGITLARYDRVIRGECVRAALAEGEGGRIRLTLSNTGEKAMAGGVTVKVEPEGAAAFAGRAECRFARLAPGAVKTVEFDLEVKGQPEKLTFTAGGSSPAIVGATLVRYGKREWSLPCRADAFADPASAADWLKAQPARVVKRSDARVAEVRAGKAGKCLAVLATVNDAAVRRGDPVWSGSCVEVFGSGMEPGAAIGQVFLAPPAGDAPAAAFRLAGFIVPAPEIRLQVLDVAEGSYTLAALIPLDLLRLSPAADAFRLEMVVTARPAGRTEHLRTALFHAVSDAAVNHAGYGVIQVQ